MKKLWIFLVVFCMLAGSVTVHADHDPNEELIGLQDFKTVRIPEPEGEVDPDAVYFTKDFAFAPEESGSYLFVATTMDEEYDYTMDVVGHTGAFPLKGGCAFEAFSGEVYTLRFQYPSYDGRTPEFTLFMMEEYNHNLRDTIALGETKTFTIPQPEGEIAESWTYFNLYLFFTPEQNGTYRFLVSYEEDESEPYDIFMDVVCPTGYWELENGCQFDAVAGETYELCFQYPTHDGRYPEFTFYVDSEETVTVPGTVDEEQVPETEAVEQITVTEPAEQVIVTEPAEQITATEPTEQIPETEPAEQIPETEADGASLSGFEILLCGAAAALLVGGLVILLIAERKRNT